MHEYAICQNIVTAVIEEYARIEPPPKRLKAVTVVAGGMHQIVPDYLAFAYEILTKETEVEGSVMHLQVTPVEGLCGDCGWKGTLELPFFECAQCKSRKIETLNGMEMLLDKLEIEENEDAGN